MTHGGKMYYCLFKDLNIINMEDRSPTWGNERKIRMGSDGKKTNKNGV